MISGNSKEENRVFILKCSLCCCCCCCCCCCVCVCGGGRGADVAEIRTFVGGNIATTIDCKTGYVRILDKQSKSNYIQKKPYSLTF